ncbi:hypothetical protein R1sor_017941 [Riccia sorocarpa]|uniref:Uncharacterized protein n=1 Tax=Riccia sorocarpa TaxID=122646 RepID=A0ABD3IEI4_9MARC
MVGGCPEGEGRDGGEAGKEVMAKGVFSKRNNRLGGGILIDSSMDYPERRSPVIRAPPMDRATRMDRATYIDRLGQPVHRAPISAANSPYPSSSRYSASPGYGRSSPDYSDEGLRRFAGESPMSYRVHSPRPPPPPPGYLDESPHAYRSRGGDSPPPPPLPPYRRYPDRPPPPGFSREYDSPPYRYNTSPPSPEYADDGNRRFHDASPHRFLSTPSPRDGGRRPYDTESPPLRYTDESPRRFAGGLSPTHYLEGPEGFSNSAQRYYLEASPRKSPQRYLEGPPPRDSSPPSAYLDDGIRRFNGGSTPPRLEEDVRRYLPVEIASPTRFDPPPRRRHEEDDHGRTTPPRSLNLRRAADGDAGRRELYGYEGADEYKDKSHNYLGSKTGIEGADAGSLVPDSVPRRFVPPEDGDGSSPSPPHDYPNLSPMRTPPRSFPDGGSVYGSPARGSTFGGSVYSSPTRASVFGGSVYGSPSRDGFATPLGHLSSSAGSSPPTPRAGPRRDSPPLSAAAAAAFGAKGFASAAAPVYSTENIPPRPGMSPPHMRPPRPDVSPSWYPSARAGNLGTPPRFDESQTPSPPNLKVPPGSPPLAHPYFKEEYSFHMPLPRRNATGYTISTPPRDFDYPIRDPTGDDAIYTARVPPIYIDEKLKERTPHQGNPGSSSGGGWKDLWAAIVFILHLGGVAAISVIFGIKNLTSTIQEYGAAGAFRRIDWFPQLCAAGVAGSIFAVVWQMAFRMAPVGMILFSIWSGAFAMSLLGIVLIATGKTTGLIGLLFFFAGLAQCLYAFVVRRRISFAGDMLKKIITILNRYPSTYMVSYLWILLAGGWTLVIIFGISGVASMAEGSFIILGYVVSLVWTMQVLRNVIRVAVAGTVSNFYVHGLDNMPMMPTYVALLRACSISLGSICFGSAIVPLVEVPCHVLRRIDAQGGASEFLFSCVTCFLRCFETLIRYFNKWAYIQVAMYGKPFVRASKDTWDMLRVQNVDCLIHDDLIGSIMLISCSVGGSLSALVGGSWTFVVNKSLTISTAIISFVIGFSFTYLTLAVYESGVATYYVMFAEDPASLQRHDGPLFEKMFVRQMDLNPQEFANPVVLM